MSTPKKTAGQTKAAAAQRGAPTPATQGAEAPTPAVASTAAPVTGTDAAHPAALAGEWQKEHLAAFSVAQSANPANLSGGAAGAEARAVIVIAKEEGFRRGGRAWSKQATTVPLDELTDDQVRALVGEPLLDVVFVGEPA